MSGCLPASGRSRQAQIGGSLERLRLEPRAPIMFKRSSDRPDEPQRDMRLTAAKPSSHTDPGDRKKSVPVTGSTSITAERVGWQIGWQTTRNEALDADETDDRVDKSAGNSAGWIVRTTPGILWIRRLQVRSLPRQLVDQQFCRSHDRRRVQQRPPSAAVVVNVDALAPADHRLESRQPMTRS
jgi:hypothetical protein